MSESIVPKPPQHSGGLVYILAAIALVAAIGGLVFWKLKGSNDAPAPVAIPAPVAPPPMLEPPPPPPPETAAEPVAPASTTHKVAAASPACGKCAGTVTSALTSAMSARAGSARPCYERALRVNSSLQGKLTVSVKVDPQGSVCGTSIAQDAIHSSEVANCVMGIFRSAKFPAPTGNSCVELQIPLSFVPREGK